MLKSSPRGLKTAYFTAVGLIGIIFITILLGIQFFIRDRFDDSMIVNLVGKQRSKAQKVSTLVHRAGFLNNHHDLFVEVKNDLEELRTRQRWFMNKVSGDSLAWSSPEFTAAYKRSQLLLHSVEAVVNQLSSAGASSGELVKQVDRVADDINQFIHETDFMVVSYIAQHKKQVHRIYNVSLVIFLIAILSLAAVGYLIFRPYLKQFADQFDELKNTKSKLDLILRNNPAVIYYAKRIGSSFQTVFVSDNIETLAGHKAEQVIKEKNFWRSNLHPDDSQKVLQSLEEKKSQKIEYRFRRKDGSYVWIKDDYQRLQDTNTGEDQIAGFMIDCSQEKMIETERQALTDRLSLAARASKMGIWEWDTREDILIWDQQMFQLHGEKDFSNKMRFSFWESFVLSDDIPHCRNVIQTALQNGEDFEMQFRIKRSDTEEVRHIKCAALLKGHIIIGANWDISQKIRKNEALEEAKKFAEQSLKVKSAFLANMSHEIRTPMNGVIGLTNLLLEKQLDPTVKKHVKTIKSCADGLLIIINDILDFSKMESGKFTLEKKGFSVRDLVDSSSSFLAPKAKAKDLVIIGHIGSDVPDQLLGDLTRVRQILLNFLSNAIKFTSYGKIEVFVHADSLPDGKWQLTFEVRDTGCGIPKEQIGKLFREFSQLETEATTKQSGTGLGLAICSRLADLMGGHVWCESEVGVGSSFYFSVVLPEYSNKILINGSGRNGRSKFEKISKEYPLKILLAEDNQVNRLLEVELLKKLGYSPDVAENGLEVLEAVRSEHYDVILMDIQMPKLSGLEAARRIHEEVLADKVPKIIALTANVMHEDRKLYRSAGMDGFIGKPINIETLVSTLKRVKVRKKHTFLDS